MISLELLNGSLIFPVLVGCTRLFCVGEVTELASRLSKSYNYLNMR